MNQQAFPLNASNNPFFATLVRQEAENEAEGCLTRIDCFISLTDTWLDKSTVSPKPDHPVLGSHDENPRGELGESTAVSSRKPSFEFVDMGTSSQTERERNRATIRSRAAMKVFQQKESAATLRNKKKKAKDSEKQYMRDGYLRTGNRPVLNLPQSSIITATPKIGRKDPFRTYPTHQVPPYADFLLDHSKLLGDWLSVPLHSVKWYSLNWYLQLLFHFWTCDQAHIAR